MKALGGAGEKGLLADHGGDACRHDAPTSSPRSCSTGSRPRGIRASSGPIPSSSTSRCWSCSPICAPTASRPSSCPAAASSSCGRGREKVYGIPPEQVVGSSGVTKFEIGADGKPVLMKTPKVEFVDDGPGKPVGINRFIGRRPIFAFGNSDGDLQMLQWTAAGSGARFMGIVHHHRRRARIGLRPAVAYRQARQGARRRNCKRLDVVNMKDRLGKTSFPPRKMTREGWGTRAWSLVAELTEIETGKRSDHPKLADALSLCRKHKAKLVIAKLDRLSRNLAFIAAMMKFGVEFIAVDNPYANKLTLHILAAVAQHEREMIAPGAQAALHAAKQRGRVLGRNGQAVVGPTLQKKHCKGQASSNPWCASYWGAACLLVPLLASLWCEKC